MVLSERNTEETRTGRRSRAASPSGHVSDESSATDDSEYSMKVGDDYQAVVPDLVSTEPCPDFIPEKALLVWSPSTDLTDNKLDEYIALAKEKYNYNVEQALGMLFWHKYDMDKATADLLNFTPFPDEWTVEDKVLFEQAFQFHGKSFHKIRQMLPDKPISSLVKYYYSWKKMRTRTSLMDRQVRKLSSQKEDGSDVGSEAESENDIDFETENNKEENGSKTSCSNCGVTSSQLCTTPKGNLCNSCYQYWRRTGTLRNASGAIKKHESTSARHNPVRSKRKPPRGMHLHYEDVVAIATGPATEGDSILRSLDSEIVSLKRQVQNNKQIISQLKHKTSSGIDHLRPPESANRIVSRWNNDELLLAVQGIRKYGRDFKAVAELIGNKTEAHVRSFFVNYRRRYNLDAVLQEFDAEHGITEEEMHEEKPDVEKTANVGSNSHPSSPGIISQGAPPLLHPPHSPSDATNGPVANSTQRLCPPPLQQAGSSRSSRTLLQQPPPLICPPTSYVNGNVKPNVHDGC